MKGIDLSQRRLGADGVSRCWSDIEKFYIGEFFNDIKDNLKKKKRTKNKAIAPILKDVYNNLYDILLAKPEELNTYCKRWDTWKKTMMISGRNYKKLHKHILEAFDYNGFRTRLNRLAVIINVKTCLYCNQQYTIALGRNPRKDGGISLYGSESFLQFDHFFEKKTYPFLSMSLYNLIPSCPFCNQRKSYKQIGLKLHPYVNDISSKIKFRIKSEDALINPKNPNLDLLEIEIDTKGDTDILNFLNDIKIKKRYARHLDIVQEIELSLYLSKYYNQYFEELSTMCYGSKDINKENLSTLERFLKGFYGKPEDINKRPLTKFSQDIYDQLAGYYTDN